MHTRADRRFAAITNMARRLKEDRNQHFNDLTCTCYANTKVMARFKEQPKLCSCAMCGNPRKYGKSDDKITRQERRARDFSKIDA